MSVPGPPDAIDSPDNERASRAVDGAEGTLRSVIITGSGAGIGRTVARRFCSHEAAARPASNLAGTVKTTTV